MVYSSLGNFDIYTLKVSYFSWGIYSVYLRNTVERLCSESSVYVYCVCSQNELKGERGDPGLKGEKGEPGGHYGSPYGGVQGPPGPPVRPVNKEGLRNIH